ncbi:hypothetical protein [Roseimaritima sediminicola]|uniref:hypothetical protein n=1 Tax=Roseimaritima sediminicola TaxID=2662066 RepID=UPI0012984BED|nr:hypothetical protein [Roseimaritima sediminicola]
MKKENLPDGMQLVSDLFGQMMRNWGAAGCPSTNSPENWRFKQHLKFDDDNRSAEVLLERTIAWMAGDELANQIPVDSGLLGRSSRTLDLATQKGEAFELIELKVDKVNSDTPLSAAIQVLNYGLANLFFQLNQHRVLPSGSDNLLLSAKLLRLRVLALVEYYEREPETIDWLSDFEGCLSQGLTGFSDQFLNPEYPRFEGFCFQAFPGDFRWDESRHADESYRETVKQAFENRSCYFK